MLSNNGYTIYINNYNYKLKINNAVNFISIEYLIHPKV